MSDNQQSDSQSEPFIPQIPVVSTTDDVQMISEFIQETLFLMEGAENVFAQLKQHPHNKEIIDNTFKVFHTIRGLAGFLDLKDIELLAAETEKLIDLGRKGKITLTPQFGVLICRAGEDMKTLLKLLDEQINNDGRLHSAYHDISEIIQQLRLITGAGDDKIRTDQIAKAADKLELGREEVGFEQLKQKYEQLLRKYQQLLKQQDSRMTQKPSDQATMEKRNAFFVNTAHEIRVLLNVILGFSKLLEKGALDHKEKEYVETIVSSGELLLNIVNSILDFSKIETGHLILENIDFNLDEMFHMLFKIIQAKIRNDAVAVDYTIGDDVPRDLVGDPTRLKQILINLTDNALKFTKQGRVHISVQLSGKQPNDDKNTVEVEFRIEDTGIGIPPEKKELIFESFVQADDSVTRQYGGTGLGLAICKSFVEAMNGRIWVESEVGKGSTFIFTARLKRQQPQEEVSMEQKGHPELGLSPEELEKISCKGKRILVAEDSKTNQELMEVYFEVFGCRGDFVNNGDEALERLKSGQYDMCFMDVEMPVLNGIEATKLIRSDLGSKIPIVALTAAVMDEERQKCLDCGMTDYLAKPFDMFDLKRKIVKHCKLHT